MILYLYLYPNIHIYIHTCNIGTLYVLLYVDMYVYVYVIAEPLLYYRYATWLPRLLVCFA